MIDYWKDRPVSATKTRIPVTLINDLYQSWSGPVTLRVKSGDRVLYEAKQDARIEALGKTNVVFGLKWPESSGPCVLEAELSGADSKPVHSVRDLEIIDDKPFKLSPSH